MTHPADRLYRFRNAAHWGSGHVEGFVFEPNNGLSTPGPMQACLAAEVPDVLQLLTADLCGRPMWLDRLGKLWVLDGDMPFRLASVSTQLAEKATRLLWGQEVAWLVSGGDLYRIDARTGDRMGNFGRAGWRVIDAVTDMCDGVLVAESRAGAGLEIRQVRPTGAARTLMKLPDTADAVALLRLSSEAPILLVTKSEVNWHVTELSPPSKSGKIVPTGATEYRLDDLRTPNAVAALPTPDRIIFATADRRAVFSASHGVLEPAIPALNCDWPIVDIVWAGGRLYLGTASALYVIKTAEDDAAPARRAQVITPALRSLLCDRSGWQRADLFCDLPEGAQVRIRSREIADPRAFDAALRHDPHAATIQEGWNDTTASLHNGAGVPGPSRHYLGDATSEWLSLRIDVSLPACAPALRVERLDVLYPNRSLIASMPAIYRTEDGSEAQLRRILAPFQALIDEIDDIISAAVDRVDPNKTTALWAGFLLSWLGHGAFAQLPGPMRLALLKALPGCLAARGTIPGLARLLDVLAPSGYAIEDAGLGPDLWVLPSRHDPEGARLGQDTRIGQGSDPGLRLGCDPLGDRHLGVTCVDPRAAEACSGSVTIRVFGGAEAEALLAPFTDRLLRHFLPAHSRARIVFGPHLPPELLEQPRPAGPAADPFALFTLDAGQSRALGAWRLPDGRAGIGQQETQTLDDAVLDGTLVLG